MWDFLFPFLEGAQRREAYLFCGTHFTAQVSSLHDGRSCKDLITGVTGCSGESVNES